MTRPIVPMDHIHLLGLICQAEILGAETISLFGFGEPLLDPTVVWGIKHCTSFKLKTFITTNASLLTVDLAHSLLDAGLSKIRFSMHGRGINYELVHRGFDFIEIMRNINNFLRINETRYDNACTTAVTVIPMHGEAIVDIRDFWEGKVDEVEIWRPHNFGEGKSYRQGKRVKKTCGRPHSGPVQIQSDGLMVACCFDFNGELVLGDTHKESVEDILKGDKYSELRKKHETGDLEGLICESCDQLFEYDKSPLLYSSVDKDRKIGRTSSTKFDLEENRENGLHKTRKQGSCDTCSG